MFRGRSRASEGTAVVLSDLRRHRSRRGFTLLDMAILLALAALAGAIATPAVLSRMKRYHLENSGWTAHAEIRASRQRAMRCPSGKGE